MQHSKSQKLRKIIQTDDNRYKLFFTVVNHKEEVTFAQRHLEAMKNSPSSNHYYLNKKTEGQYKIGNYLIQQTLGEGTFGKVKLGVYLPNNERVAVKVLEKDRIRDKDDRIRVDREFDMLSTFNHPNVILVTEIFESSESYYSVMEYCEGGELFNYIVKKKRLTEKETAFLFFQIINGLEYIHSLGIVHRDLKPENLLLTRDHLLKIIDFGLSNYFKEGQSELLSTPCGSPCYASPEMVSGKKYDGVKIDIWATGIILFAMLCGYLPFEDNNNDALFDKILECKIEFPEYLSDESIDLIKKILVVNPDERITIPGIKKHSFFIRGKQLFDSVFTIKPIIDSPPENQSQNKSENNDEAVENKNNEEENKNEDEHNSEVNEKKVNNEIKNKNKNDLIDNKENNNNDNIKYINNENKKKDNRNKRNNKIPIINKTCPDEKKIKKDNSEEIKVKQKKTKNIKKPKELNGNYIHYTDKKNNNKKVTITDNNLNNARTNKNIKEQNKNLIVNSKNLMHKIPDGKNKLMRLKDKIKIHSKHSNNLILNAISKDRNTISIASIGSSVIETINNLSQQTNITNLMINNINYNVNISFDHHTKRTYSHENTKDITHETTNKFNTNNTMTNNNISNNNTLKNNNNINIVENNNNNNSNNLSSNNGEINNYILEHFNYINKKNKNKGRRNQPDKIKQILKDPKTTKLYYNSEIIKKLRKEMDFNICKLINDSYNQKDYKEYLSKKKKGILTTKNNDSISKIKDEQLYNKKTNHLKILKNINISMNELKKNNINKDQNNKNISSYKNKNLSAVHSNNSKIKNNKNILKSNLINKNNNKKLVNKLQYKNIFHKPTHIKESIIVNMQTDPNINIKNKINQSTKNNEENSKINQNPTIETISNNNVKYSGNNIKREKQYLNSPIKKGRIRQKLIKSNHINKLFNSSNKKKYKTIHNIITNYKMYKPNLISISTNTNKTEQRIIPEIKSKISNVNTNKNETQSKLMEEASKSIEFKNNNYTFLIDKNKHIKLDNKIEKENITNLSNINNTSNIETGSLLMRIRDKTPEHAKIKSKAKNVIKIGNKNSSNEIIIQSSERHPYNNEKTKLLKMNKFRNICLKNNEEINNIKNNYNNKKSHITTIKKIINLNNNRENLIKKNINLQRNIISFSTRMSSNINRNHLKYNSMKLNDIYKNNIRRKNNLQKVYLIKNKNNDESGNISNPALTQKHIICIKDLETNKNRENKK